MTRTAGAPIGCQRPSRFWGLGCPKIYHEAEDTLAEAIAPADVFSLHSRPGSSNVVYLDFDGHTIENTAWNNSSGVASYEAVPYDLDGNAAVFNDEERSRIGEIWHRIAEDLAPFDIDVTTEEPAAFNSNTGRILITRSTTATNADMPSSGAGGVALSMCLAGQTTQAITLPPWCISTTLVAVRPRRLPKLHPMNSDTISV